MKWAAILGAVVLLALGGLWRAAQKKVETGQTKVIKEGEMMQEATEWFGNPIKSAHWVSNTPEHGVTLPAPPINVVVDFDFDLAEGSQILITHGKEGKDYGARDWTVVDANKLAMRRVMDPAAPDGVYVVEYKACWPDGSCHKGEFQFAIDRSLLEEFSDQRFKEKVEIRMKDIKFQPAKIRISSGTEVTWVNDDEVVHYVNTDSHPVHTYYPGQNSRALRKGESFTLSFANPGTAVYPYHCSAHARVMTGMIVVE